MPGRTCSNCLHSRTCHMRIELSKQINRFKYLAMTKEEVANTTAETTVGELYHTLCRACTQYTHPQE